MPPAQPCPTLFPYTTLFRSLSRHGLAAPVPANRMADQVAAICGAHAQVMSAAEVSIGIRVSGITREDVRHALWDERSLVRSEEHTSELQSPINLVCRLLLEK